MDIELSFRPAVREDIRTLVGMLADDDLGAQREKLRDPLPDDYFRAFTAICEDPNNELVVAEHEGEIVGMLQITFIPYLTYQGGWRALVEGVRINRQRRGQGLGRRMFEWAIARARERGCHLVQLTTDKARSDAVRFYESLGFKATHEGMKLHLG